MFSKHYFTRHSSVTVRDILMHHDSNVGWARKNVINIMTVGFGYFLSELGPFNSFTTVHKHICIFHNSMVIRDIFVKFYRITNLVRTMYLAQE